MFKVMLIPAIGSTVQPHPTHARADVAERFGIGYAMALTGKDYGKFIDVVVINQQTREAVSDTRVRKER